MGTLTTFDFEGTDGATLSGAGIALQGAGSATHATSEAVVGGTGALFVATAGNPRSARCTITSGKIQCIDVFLRTPSTVPVATTFQVATLRHASGTILSVEYNSAGQLAVYETAGAVRTAIPASDVAVSTWFRLSLRVNIGVSTNDSTLTAKVYSSGSNWTTQIGTDLARTGTNLGTAAAVAVDVGAITAVTPGLTIGADYLRAEDGRTTEFGGPPSATAPTAAASASDQYPQVGVSVNLLSTGSTAGSGSLTGYFWTCTEFPSGASSPSISNPTTATASAIPASAGRYTFQVVVTQTGGLTGTATTTVYVYPLSADDVKVFSVNAGSWTNEGGAVSLVAAMNDASAATFGQSPTNPTGQKMRLVMNPYGPGTVSVLVSGYWSGGALTRTVDIFMEDGVTLLSTTTYALTSVEVEREIALDAGDLATASAGLNRRALVVDIADA